MPIQRTRFKSKANLLVEPHGQEPVAPAVRRNPPKLQSSFAKASEDTRIPPRSGDRGFLRRRVIIKSVLILVIFTFLRADIALCQFEQYELMAVYLERIARFVEWPDKTESSVSDDYFVIGVLGENPFGTILTDLYAERTIKNKNIQVRYLSQLNEIEGCNLLFISRSMSEELPRILEITAKKPILTVGDTEGFAEKGVLVNLFIENNKLRFEINEQGLQEAGILIDSLLLKVAKIVNPLKEME